MKILVIDVGGTNVKIKLSRRRELRKTPSGPEMTAQVMVDAVKRAGGLGYDAVTIGYPGPVIGGQIRKEPHNLGKGWVGFDFSRAFGKPVKLINDAAMQRWAATRAGACCFWASAPAWATAMILDGVMRRWNWGTCRTRRARRSRSTSASRD